VIFVTVGTNEAQFDRLLRAVAKLPIEEELLIQHGHSSPTSEPHVKLVDFLPFEELVETVRRARVVISHAGVGTVMVALANARRPVVVPRRKAFGEAVDDHQLQLGRRFAAIGLVTLVEAPEALGDVLTRTHDAPAFLPASSTLATDLRLYLEGRIVPPLSPLP
jgi:UDP-N-acetylglucosamine transferase subunit ALG13